MEQGSTEEQVKAGIDEENDPGGLGIEPTKAGCVCAELNGSCKANEEKRKIVAAKITHIFEILFCKVPADIYSLVEKSS